MQGGGFAAVEGLEGAGDLAVGWGGESENLGSEIKDRHALETQQNRRRDLTSRRERIPARISSGMSICSRWQVRIPVTVSSGTLICKRR